MKTGAMKTGAARAGSAMKRAWGRAAAGASPRRTAGGRGGTAGRKR